MRTRIQSLEDEIDGHGFRGLEENHPVEFEVTQGPKGPQAVHVASARAG